MLTWLALFYSKFSESTTVGLTKEIQSGDMEIKWRNKNSPSVAKALLDSVAKSFTVASESTAVPVETFYSIFEGFTELKKSQLDKTKDYSALDNFLEAQIAQSFIKSKDNRLYIDKQVEKNINFAFSKIIAIYKAREYCQDGCFIPIAFVLNCLHSDFEALQALDLTNLPGYEDADTLIAKCKGSFETICSELLKLPSIKEEVHASHESMKECFTTLQTDLVALQAKLSSRLLDAMPLIMDIIVGREILAITLGDLLYPYLYSCGSRWNFRNYKKSPNFLLIPDLTFLLFIFLHRDASKLAQECELTFTCENLDFFAALNSKLGPKVTQLSTSSLLEYVANFPTTDKGELAATLSSVKDALAERSIHHKVVEAIDDRLGLVCPNPVSALSTNGTKTVTGKKSAASEASSNTASTVILVLIFVTLGAGSYYGWIWYKNQGLNE